MTRRLRGEPVNRAPNYDIFMTFAAHHVGQPLSRYYQDHRVLVDANLAVLEASKETARRTLNLLG